jgi:hypothetical protein
MVTRTAKKPKPAHNAFKDREATVRFEGEAKELIRAAMADQKFTHGELSAALGEIGIGIGDGALANKISRGGFSAAFLLQCMDVMGLKLAAKAKR